GPLAEYREEVAAAGGILPTVRCTKVFRPRAWGPMDRWYPSYGPLCPRHCHGQEKGATVGGPSVRAHHHDPRPATVPAEQPYGPANGTRQDLDGRTIIAECPTGYEPTNDRYN